jgi:hypothetical protein
VKNATDSKIFQNFAKKFQNMAELSQQEFKRLHEELFTRYESECKASGQTIPSTKKQRYGYDLTRAEEGREFSLRSCINRCETVQEKYGKEFKADTKNCLYENWKNAIEQNKIDRVNIPDRQFNAFLCYLGIDRLQELPQPTVEKLNYIEYEGYFYSYVRNKVLQFSAGIAFDKHPYAVRMEGFHQNKNAPIYTGLASRKNDYLFFNLVGQRDNWEDEFKLIAHVSTVGAIQDVECLRCLFLGVSTYDYPTAGEIILLNKEKEQAGSATIAMRYLALKHNRIRIKTNRAGNLLSELKVKNKFITEIEHMIGCYKVFNLNAKREIVISKFTIQDDYLASFETAVFSPNENNQVCLMEISNVRNKRLCITTHPKEGADVISYVMLKIPGAAETISEGVFCAVGGASMPSSGPIVLLKIPANATDFRPEMAPVETYIENADADTKKACNRLIEIIRSNKINY